MSVWFLKNVNEEDVSKMLKNAYGCEVLNVDLTFVKNEDEEQQYVQFIAKCKNLMIKNPFTFMGRIFPNKIQCTLFNKPIGKQYLGELKKAVSTRLSQNIFNSKNKKQTILDNFTTGLSNTFELNKYDNLEVEMENKSSEEQIIHKLQETFPEFSGFEIVNLEKVHAPRPELHFTARGEVANYDEQLDEEGNYAPEVYLFTGVKSGKYFDVVHKKQEEDEEVRVL